MTHAEFVDRCLDLVSVRYVRMDTADEATMAYSFYTLAHSQTSVRATSFGITTLPADELRTTHVRMENGAWCFLNGRGELYDRHDAVLFTP